MVAFQQQTRDTKCCRAEAGFSIAELLKLYRIRERLGMSRMATGLRLPVLALISPSFGFLALKCCDVRL